MRIPTAQVQIADFCPVRANQRRRRAHSQRITTKIVAQQRTRFADLGDAFLDSQFLTVSSWTSQSVLSPCLAYSSFGMRALFAFAR